MPAISKANPIIFNKIESKTGNLRILFILMNTNGAAMNADDHTIINKIKDCLFILGEFFFLFIIDKIEHLGYYTHFIM